MSARPSSRPFKPTALGRRFRIAVSALALSGVIGLGVASQSLADTGSVYFDTTNNTAAGETLFNGTFIGFNNVGVGRSVMPTWAAAATTSRSGTARSPPTRPASTTSRPAATRSVSTPPATTTSRLAATVEGLQRQVERLRAQVKGG